MKRWGRRLLFANLPMISMRTGVAFFTVLTFVLSGCSSDRSSGHQEAGPGPVQGSGPAPSPIGQKDIRLVNECATFPLNRFQSVDYCIDHPEGTPLSNKVLYFFHGILGQARDWESIPLRELLLQKARRGEGEYPTVISISFGRTWFLTDVSSLSSPSRRDVFQRVLVPGIENRHGLRPSGRITLGLSMGGYNAMASFAGAPSGSVQATIGLCPATMTVGPYSSLAEAEAFFQRNQGCVDKKLYGNILVKAWVSSEFPTKVLWNENLLTTLFHRRLLAKNQLIVYNDCDDWGFNEGSETYARSAGGEPSAEVRLGLIKEISSKHCQFSAPTNQKVVDYIIKQFELTR